MGMKIIGMMSGTSADGVDAALLAFDQGGVQARIAAHFEPYSSNERAAILGNMGKWQASKAALEAIHAAHNRALAQMPPADFVGFHGQTLNHDPTGGRSFQAGDPGQLATDATIIYDFRSSDIDAGGEGAPLVPIYHYALAKELGLQSPVVFVNIGGVSNVSYVDISRPPEEGLLAFDAGPGNAMSDDLMQHFFDMRYDENGKIAKEGRADARWIEKALALPFFAQTPPKSLDRLSLYQDFEALKNLPPADAIATAMGFTIAAIKKALTLMPSVPGDIILCGGGRKNQYLADALGAKNIDDFGLDGDMIEAEGFAYLTWLRLQNRPASFPLTTRVRAPIIAGRIYGDNRD